MVAKLKKSFMKERQKACGTQAPRKYARPTYGAPPRKLRKNDSQEKCFCQSYNCAVAKVWRIVCESNCIDEPAGENCHTEVDPERRALQRFFCT